MTALQFAESCKPARKLRAEEIAQQEAEVGGALGETAHEVGEPVVAVRNVNAQRGSHPSQAALQVGAYAIEHLKLEIILGDLLGRRPANGLRNHVRIVRGNAVVEAAGQQHLHQSNVIGSRRPLCSAYATSGNSL